MAAFRNWKINLKMDPGETTVFVDGVELRDCVAIEVSQTMASMPLVTVSHLAESVELEVEEPNDA